MMSPDAGGLVQRFHERNAISSAFFAAESDRLAAISQRMAHRFARGGRLLAFGTGAAASDAQHVAVEFVHPVIAGKQALPALDLSHGFDHCLPALLRPDDIVLGLGPPQVDARVQDALRYAHSRGALAIALPGAAGDDSIPAASADAFVHQEVIEIACHVLWETVHVFLERVPVGHGGGAASFLYPFLADASDDGDTVAAVAASIRAKAAGVAQLRDDVAAGQSHAIVAMARDVAERTIAGATVLCFGNGGSATDATDLALDLTASPKGHPAVPAISLASDAATLTALANDIGADAMFRRQLIAHGRRGDVAVAISTSGGSANVLAALTEARARGLLTLALLGYDGGEVARRRLADHVVVVASDQIPRVQETHASIYHVFLDLLAALRNPR